jgi:hypothetical protein
MTEDKKAIALKIRALLAKTADRGCSEAEAIAAAAKAKELLDKYQIDLSEHELEEEGFVKGKAEKAQARRFNVQETLAHWIAKFCEVKVWHTFDSAGYRRKEKRIVFFGLRSDVEFANWLTVALEAFVWHNADEYETKLKYEHGPTVGGYYLKRDFAMGACARINQRLRAEVEARKPQTMSDGRALMVVKNQLVEREFNKLGMSLGSASPRSYKHGDAPPDAYAAGRAAGDRASFGRPVGASSGPRLKLT